LGKSNLEFIHNCPGARMARRKTLAVCLVAVASLTLLASRFLEVPHRSLRVDNFPLIRVGMPQAEVEDLLGGPPGNYGRYAPGMMTAEGYLAPLGSTEKIWYDDCHRFEIYFDGAERVVGIHRRASYRQVPPTSSNWFDKLLRRLGL